MAESKCPYHADHENRIGRLEEDMKDVYSEVRSVQEKQKSPAVLIAFMGLVGTAMATVGSVVGFVLTAYLKSKGLL
jgi:hypothetical protein